MDKKNELDELTGDALEYGNPNGAGRYRYIRSSEDKNAMMYRKQAEFDLLSGRWFEQFGCGYAHWRDGKASCEADDIDQEDFHYEHPNITCKESFYEIEYGNTRDEAAYAFFFMAECEGRKIRDFAFSCNDITMAEVNEYISALEDWHRTGEFNAGQYRGIPQYDPWTKR